MQNVALYKCKLEDNMAVFFYETKANILRGSWPSIMFQWTLLQHHRNIRTYRHIYTIHLSTYIHIHIHEKMFKRGHCYSACMTRFFQNRPL